MAWYNDVLRGIGLTATGAASGAFAGGNAGGLLGGIYGATKAGLGGASEGGSSYTRNLYQTALPTAAAGVLLHPSAVAADSLLTRPGGVAGDPSRLGAQLAYLKSEVSSLGSGAWSGAGTGVSAVADKTGDFFSTVGKGGAGLLSGLGTGVGKLLSGTSPEAIGRLLNQGLDRAGGISAPSLTSILGGSSTPSPAATQIIPIPVGGNAPAPQQAAMSPIALVLIAGIAVYLFFKKGVLR